MPETGERKASEYGAHRWFEKVKADPLILRSIWVDATDKEMIYLKSNTRAQAGLVYELDSETKCKRGSQHAQQSVYPPLSKDVSSLGDLRLQGVHSTPRTIILDLDKLWLQVCFVFLFQMYQICRYRLLLAHLFRHCFYAIMTRSNFYLIQ